MDVTDRKIQLTRRIRVLLVVFMAGLVLAGLTAIPTRTELNALARFMGASSTDTPQTTTGILRWVVRVRNALDDAYGKYPFLAYANDWLAFGHFVIALAFLGALRDPVRNVWVVEWGMMACVAVVPMALIFGPLRDIPFYHQLVDCSFGVFGIIPLWLCRRSIGELETMI